MQYLWLAKAIKTKEMTENLRTSSLSKGFDQLERASDNQNDVNDENGVNVHKQISLLLNIDKCVLILRLWLFGLILWKTSPICIE